MSRSRPWQVVREINARRRTLRAPLVPELQLPPATKISDVDGHHYPAGRDSYLPFFPLLDNLELIIVESVGDPIPSVIVKWVVDTGLAVDYHLAALSVLVLCRRILDIALKRISARVLYRRLSKNQRSITRPTACPFNHVVFLCVGCPKYGRVRHRRCHAHREHGRHCDYNPAIYLHMSSP